MRPALLTGLLMTGCAGTLLTPADYTAGSPQVAASCDPDATWRK
jgi:hypothetical protein